MLVQVKDILRNQALLNFFKNVCNVINNKYFKDNFELKIRKIQQTEFIIYFNDYYDIIRIKKINNTIQLRYFGNTIEYDDVIDDNIYDFILICCMSRVYYYSTLKNYITKDTKFDDYIIMIMSETKNKNNVIKFITIYFNDKFNDKYQYLIKASDFDLI